MSSFAGVDLFGSGPSKMLVQPETFSTKLSGYAGLNGAEALLMGGRGRRIAISGQLKAATVVALETIIGLIETARRNGPGILVDNDGISWFPVVLVDFRTGPFKNYTSTGVFVQYTINAVQI